jgi:hypothetical protein
VELAERIAVVTSPYEQLYKYKGIEPEEFQLGCARARYHRFPLYKIDDPFDPNCARAHWEKYHKKAIELGATANELPTKTNSPFYDLIQLGKFCSARASGQKKEEKPKSQADLAETKQNAKRIGAAILISSVTILLFELFVYFGPITWLKNHPNSYGIQGSIICLIPCLILGFLKPRWRNWCWGTASLAFLGLILSLLGGRPSQ